MNMAISSAPSAPAGASAAASNATAGTAPASASGSSLFAGALVQALAGGGPAAKTAGNALSIPVGLLGLLNPNGSENPQTEKPDVLTMLTQLAGQLASVQQGGAPVSKDTENALSSLLSALQQLFPQLGLALKRTSEQDAGSSGDLLLGSDPSGTDTESQQPVIAALLLQLQQLAALTQNDEPAANQVSGLDEQFQEALNALSQTGAANLPAAHERKTAKAANDTQPAQWNDKSASVAPVQQTPAAAPVVTANARNTAATLRDPVWRFTVDPAANAQASADAATGSNAEPAPAASTTAPAWTLSSLVPNTDNNPTAQAQLPAQVPVQQFAEQMEKFLVKQFALTHGNGTAEAKLTLHPDHLGQVDVRIVLQNGQLTAQFMTENGMARDLLENQMSQLRSALQGQGLQVDRMEVVQQPTSSSTMSFLQQQDQQRQSNSGGGNSSSGQSRGGLYDDAEFETELAGTSLIPQIGYGSSINVTA